MANLSADTARAVPNTSVAVSPHSCNPILSIETLKLDDEVPFMSEVPLRVSDGIYMIKSAMDGRVVETAGVKLAPSHAVHVFLGPSREARSQTQIWWIKGKGREPAYSIHSLAFGSALDVWWNSPASGSHVCSHEPHGAGCQTWAFYGSRRGTPYVFPFLGHDGPADSAIEGTSALLDVRGYTLCSTQSVPPLDLIATVRMRPVYKMETPHQPRSGPSSDFHFTLHLFRSLS